LAPDPAERFAVLSHSLSRILGKLTKMGKKENRKGTKNKKEGNEKEQEKKSKKEEIGKSMSRTDYRSLGLAATC